MNMKERSGMTVKTTYPATTTYFVAETKIAGEVQVGLGSIWLGQSIGSVASGMYEGTQLISTGNKGAAIAVYVKREGKHVGTIVVNLDTILTAAISEFERIEAAQEQEAAAQEREARRRNWPVDHEEGE